MEMFHMDMADGADGVLPFYSFFLAPLARRLRRQHHHRILFKSLKV